MIELSGVIDENGKPQIYNRYLLDQWFKQHAGQKFTLVVDKKKKKRSSEQNKYYWGCVVPMVREGLINMGNEVSLEETHEFLKASFHYKEIVNEETGEIVKLPLSTGKLSTYEFSIYKEKIQHFASEFLNIVIPDPNQPLAIDFK